MMDKVNIHSIDQYVMVNNFHINAVHKIMETYTTIVDVSADAGREDKVSVRIRVDTGWSGNVIRLHIFQYFLPACID